MNNKTINEFGFRRIERIMQISEGVRDWLKSIGGGGPEQRGGGS